MQHTEARRRGDDTEKTRARDRPAKRGAEGDRTHENASLGRVIWLGFSGALSPSACGRLRRPRSSACWYFSVRPPRLCVSVFAFLRDLRTSVGPDALHCARYASTNPDPDRFRAHLGGRSGGVADDQHRRGGSARADGHGSDCQRGGRRGVSRLSVLCQPRGPEGPRLGRRGVLHRGHRGSLHDARSGDCDGARFRTPVQDAHPRPQTGSRPSVQRHGRRRMEQRHRWPRSRHRLVPELRALHPIGLRVGRRDAPACRRRGAQGLEREALRRARRHARRRRGERRSVVRRLRPGRAGGSYARPRRRPRRPQAGADLRHWPLAISRPARQLRQRCSSDRCCFRRRRRARRRRTHQDRPDDSGLQAARRDRRARPAGGKPTA